MARHAIYALRKPRCNGVGTRANESRGDLSLFSTAKIRRACGLLRASEQS